MARIWLGWQDSNLRMPESKSGALPLGDTPIYILSLSIALGLNILVAGAGFEPTTFGL